jgi:pimeloyl-ACP methyl ester carboxylesterase
MPYVETAGGIRLFYSDWGHTGDPAVVFVHAWGLHGGMWHYQVPAFLAAGRRCVLLDRRGHGRSDLPGYGYDLDTLADDLAHTLERLDLAEVVLVGHSMGAAEVVRYLTRHGRQRVLGVVLSAPTTPYLLRTDDNPDGIDEAAFEANRQALRTDVGATIGQTTSSDYFGPGYPLSEALADWTRRQIIDTPLPVLLATQEAFTTADLRAELAGLTVPVLVIHGSADRSAPIDQTGRRTSQAVPGARLVVIDGAGHGMYMSAAHRYNTELLMFGGKINAR